MAVHVPLQTPLRAHASMVLQEVYAKYFQVRVNKNFIKRAYLLGFFLLLTRF